MFSGFPNRTSLGMSSSEVVRAIDMMGLWRGTEEVAKPDKLRGDAVGKVKAPLPTKGRTRAARAKVGMMLLALGSRVWPSSHLSVMQLERSARSDQPRRDKNFRFHSCLLPPSASSSWHLVSLVVLQARPGPLESIDHASVRASRYHRTGTYQRNTESGVRAYLACGAEPRLSQSKSFVEIEIEIKLDFGKKTSIASKYQFYATCRFTKPQPRIERPASKQDTIDRIVRPCQPQHALNALNINSRQCSGPAAVVLPHPPRSFRWEDRRGSVVSKTRRQAEARGAPAHRRSRASEHGRRRRIARLSGQGISLASGTRRQRHRDQRAPVRRFHPSEHGDTYQVEQRF